ncbi:MAG TPA: aspartate aminotransferase family protein [Xanthobacteraceae bacterium]|nr:aspartate aminotransferase family protein [Xanthobacteraceae bacterium]
MFDTPNSAEARDVRHHLHSYSNPRRLDETGPLVIERGEGIYVFDSAGKRYLEGVSALWYASLGFSEKRLVEAAYRQMQMLPCYHSFGHKVTENAVDLAEMLIAIAPVPMSKVYFCGSGSEGNDTALKVVRYVNNALGRPAKKKVISRIRGYHGTTLATASLTGIARNHTSFDLPIDGILHTDCPLYYRYGEAGESEAAFVDRIVGNLEQMILREGPETIAAFWAEPILGSGGVIVPPEGYYEKVQALLRKYDILFVVDEVICGFGRLGHMFGSQAFGLEPDMIIVAKALSSGYQPIAALLVNEKVFSGLSQEADKIGVFGHGFTYSAHPVPTAVAIETLKIYEERDIIAHVRAVSPRFQDGLRAFAGNPFVGDVRGLGLIAGLEIVKDKTTRENFPPERRAALELEMLCLDEGLVVRAIGDTVALSPPLIITEREIDELLASFGRGLARFTAQMSVR